MNRRTTLVLIGLLTLALLACNPVSRLTNRAQETAEAAVTSVVATVSSLPTTAPELGKELKLTATALVPEVGKDLELTATALVPAPDEDAGEAVDLDDLDALNSYRADWATTVRSADQDGGTTLEYKLEWVKNPPAQHIWMDVGAGATAEVIWVEDKAWVKAGNLWIPGGNLDTDQAFANFHEALEVDDDMMLVGTETVNGMQTKHYLSDHESPAQNTRVHREIWVADEAGLPAVPVRGLYRVESTSGQDTTTTQVEVDIYDLNEPIEIEPPG